MKVNIKLPDINPVVALVLQWASISIGVWAVLSFFVMEFWNLSMPGLGLPELSYKAAIGIVGLATLVLGIWYVVCKEKV